jgi:hypothetical protein
MQNPFLPSHKGAEQYRFIGFIDHNQKLRQVWACP